ncbi:MAG: hypothetical protein J2P55_11065 [Rhizobiales bacterium]|nr:hypothetical protein [Hyphomicrobiales bacterium]
MDDKKTGEGFYNVTFHQLTADELVRLMFSDVSDLAPLEITKVDHKDDLYGDCADLIGGYKTIALVKR